MEYRKRNLLFTLFVFLLVGVFSIASISAINYKKKKHKTAKKGKIVVKMKKGKTRGTAKIKYDAKKGKNGKASMELEVKKLRTIMPTDNYEDPRYYEGWFILGGDEGEDYEVSTGVFNTDKKGKGKAYFEFKPNKIDDAVEAGTGIIGHNLSALKQIKITKEANNGVLERDGNVVLSGKVKFKKNPYKSLYGSKLK
ncbi:MAG: hypothetical protein D6734_11925 [Candidatus Schekmanbacteria bacterium]|nr:MAG: hypothetical protein D6734_11925 [Candidatus Schekmanbacteria bacterium]